MRNLQREAAIWYLFTSPRFLDAAAGECLDTVAWLAARAPSKWAADAGRADALIRQFNHLACDFRAGASPARRGQYRAGWEVARAIRSTLRPYADDTNLSWLTERDRAIFHVVRIARLIAYADGIEGTLEATMTDGRGAALADDGMPARFAGFVGDGIASHYDMVRSSWPILAWRLPNPAPRYVVDGEVACRTGEIAPWTGVWFPATGLEQHGLAFTFAGATMPPVHMVGHGRGAGGATGLPAAAIPAVALATTWYPLVLEDVIARADAASVGKGQLPLLGGGAMDNAPARSPAHDDTRRWIDGVDLDRAPL